MEGLPMNLVDQGVNSTWWQVYKSPHDFRDITWEDLLGIARLHWNWVSAQQNAYTIDTGSCLVAALMMPSTSGARIFLSTIARGSRREEMRRHGAANAPAWYTALGPAAGNLGHAESAAEYLFETSRYARGVVSGGRYRVDDRDNPNSRMKLAVWGYKPGYAATGQPVALCSECTEVAIRLNIDYWTQAKSDRADRLDRDSYGRRRLDMPPPPAPGSHLNTTPYRGYPVAPPAPRDNTSSYSGGPGGSSSSRAPPSGYGRAPAPAPGKSSSKSKSSRPSASDAQLSHLMNGMHIGGSTGSKSSSKKKVSRRY